MKQCMSFNHLGDSLKPWPREGHALGYENSLDELRSADPAVFHQALEQLQVRFDVATGFGRLMVIVTAELDVHKYRLKDHL